MSDGTTVSPLPQAEYLLAKSATPVQVTVHGNSTEPMTLPSKNAIIEAASQSPTRIPDEPQMPGPHRPGPLGQGAVGRRPGRAR